MRLMCALAVIILFQILGCRTIRQPNSDFKITNSTKSEDPATVLLFEGDDHCSGTLVAPDVVLTAGHCATETDNGKYRVYANHFDEETKFDDIGVEKIFLHPKFRRGKKKPETITDLALLKLSSNAAGVVPRKLLNDLVLEGDEVTLIGYGRVGAEEAESNEDINQYTGKKILPRKVALDDASSEKNPDLWADDFLEWKFYREAWQVGVLEIRGQRSAKFNKKVRVRGSAIMHGDSGGTVLVGERLAAVISSGAVLEKYVISDATLLSHDHAISFFCAAEKESFFVEWENRQGKSSKPECYDENLQFLYPWTAEKTEWQIYPTRAALNTYDYFCQDSAPSWLIASKSMVESVLANQNSPFWKNAPKALSSIPPDQAWVWLIDRSCVKGDKEIEDCGELYNLRTGLSKRYDGENDSETAEALFLCYRQL